MIRLGLCCVFRDQPIKFRTTTAAAITRIPRPEQLRRLGAIALGNAHTLQQALRYCAAHDIGCFRINSQILPLRTHPAVGYSVADLPNAKAVVEAFKQCGEFACRQRLRLTFHPDQFVVLNSPTRAVVSNSIAELNYQAEVAGWVGADVINIHGGGAYGDKATALARLRRNLLRLSYDVRRRLTLENDDRIYTPADLLPVCEAAGIPFVYDVHHHRCIPDGLSVEEVTRRAIATWDREPLFHVSGPARGWTGPNPRVHHEFVRVRDVPPCWQELEITVEVEARAKEVAIRRLQRALRSYCATKRGTRRARRVRPAAHG
jgi:UV DNA damage endonuclease